MNNGRIIKLKQEHYHIDSEITTLSRSPVNQLQIQRLKKCKLMVKEEIDRLQEMLAPDLVA
ncbi:MAG: YdcH family protein [Alphaproteobacteria bacterium]